jgi:hypothetical protein
VGLTNGFLPGFCCPSRSFQAEPLQAAMDAAVKVPHPAHWHYVLYMFMLMVNILHSSEVPAANLPAGEW